MAQQTATPVASPVISPPPRALLTCGVLAGPLFMLVAILLVVTRDGFDLRRHPLSLLSLGEFGWVQVANFVVAGLLYVAGAVGMRRAMPAGPGRIWGPRLIGVFGALLVWAGVFAADPAEGFPPGTPDGVGEPSWHGVLHSFGPALAFPVLAAACLVFARRFAAQRRPGPATACVATAVVLFTPDLFLGGGWFYVALTSAAAVGWGWASTVAGHLLSAGDREPRLAERHRRIGSGRRGPQR